MNEGGMPMLAENPNIYERLEGLKTRNAELEKRFEEMQRDFQMLREDYQRKLGDVVPTRVYANSNGGMRY